MYVCTYIYKYILPLILSAGAVGRIASRFLPKGKHTQTCMHMYVHTCMQIFVYMYTYIYIYIGSFGLNSKSYPQVPWGASPLVFSRWRDTQAYTSVYMYTYIYMLLHSVYAHSRKRAQAQGQRLGTWTRVHQVTRCAYVCRCRGAHRLSFSPDGETLACLSRVSRHNRAYPGAPTQISLSHILQKHSSVFLLRHHNQAFRGTTAG